MTNWQTFPGELEYVHGLIRQCIEAGLSLNDTARHVGVSSKTVQRYSQKLNAAHA